jgi:hypothetical protein
LKPPVSPEQCNNKHTTTKTHNKAINHVQLIAFTQPAALKKRLIPFLVIIICLSEANNYQTTFIPSLPNYSCLLTNSLPFLAFLQPLALISVMMTMRRKKTRSSRSIMGT